MFYCQLDYEAVSYPSPSSPHGNIANNGCGPCAASMIVEEMCQTPFPPEESAALAKACGAREGFGTDMRIFGPVFAERFGLSCEITDNPGYVRQFLTEKRGLVIANTLGDREGWTGVFSDSKHYIVVVSLDEKGEAGVWDPMYREGRYEVPGRKGKVRMDGTTAYADFSIIEQDCIGRNYFLFRKLQRVPVKEITLSGEAYERGFQYGESCRAEILLSIEIYSRLIEKRKGISWEKVKEISLVNLEATKALFAEKIKEMQGIADGAGVEFADIFALNSRSELLHTQLVNAMLAKEGVCCAPESGGTCCDDAKIDVDECTGISLLPAITENGHTYAAQSWDFSHQLKETVVVLRYLPEGNRPGFIMFTEAGMIGAPGMNTCGIGITLNALVSPSSGIGIPLRFRMRKVLESRDLSSAYGALMDGAMGSSGNLILSHRDGLSMDVEFDMNQVDVIPPEDGLIVHTNHWVGAKNYLSHAHRDRGSTYMRYQRAKALFAGKKDVNATYIEQAYRDHKGYPTSICVHALDDDILTSVTNYALIMDLNSGEIRFALGNPCETVFNRYECK